MTNIVAGMLCLPQLRLAAGKTTLGHFEGVNNLRIYESMHAIWPQCPARLDCASDQYLFVKLYSLQSAMYSRINSVCDCPEAWPCHSFHSLY